MRKILIPFILTGCVVQTGFGNGQLIHVRVSDDFSAHEVELIRDAAFGWDIMGCNLRLSEDLNGVAPYDVIDIKRVAGSGVNNTYGITLPFAPEFHHIIIYADYIWERTAWADHYPDIAFSTAVAHELGHAMGLEHVSNTEARMYDTVSSDNWQLTSDDKKEFCRHYQVDACN